MGEAPAPFTFTKPGSGGSSPPKRSKSEYHGPVSDNVRSKGVEKSKNALSGKGVTVERPEAKKGGKPGKSGKGDKGNRSGFSAGGNRAGGSGGAPLGPSGDSSGEASDDDQVL